MKQHKISVSSQDLTRCAGCSRHHHIDRSLSAVELWELKCDFCGEKLLNGHQSDAHNSTAPLRVKREHLGARSSKIALGLLGASLSMSACTPDEPVTNTMMRVDMTLAGEPVMAGEYGSFPAGDPFGNIDMELAGEPVMAGEYGAFPAGYPVEPIDMMVAGGDFAQSDYGAPPAGVEAGVEAGETAGTTAGASAGTSGGESAGASAGGSAGVEMMTAGDNPGAPEYGAPPAGEG